MRTWLVLAAVLAVAAAALADALRERLDRPSEPAALKVTPASRIVPPGVPAGFMGTVYYSDPKDACRLKTLSLPGFDPVNPPAYRRCRFTLSPDGSHAFGGDAQWSPDGELVAIPYGETFALASPDAHQSVLLTGHAPAFKRDGTLTFFLHGRLVESTSRCRMGEYRFTLPGDVRRLRCAQTVWRGRATAIAWLSPSRFAAISRAGNALLVEDGTVLVRAHLPPHRTARLSASPRRNFVSIWLDGELAGTFDAGGGPVAMPPVPHVRALAWSPSERWAVLATARGSVYIFRPNTGDARLRRLDIHARDLAWR
jgi:hypothetical protein